MISKLPERILAECSRIILESGEAVFDEAARLLKDLPGAPPDLRHRPTHNNRLAVMEKTRIFLRSNPAVLDHPRIKALLSANSLYQRFTIVLSEEAITVACKAFACGLGEPAIMLALYLDQRPKLREIAEKHLAENPSANPWADCDGKSEMAGFFENFTAFLLSLKSFLPDTESEAQGGVQPSRKTEERAGVPEKAAREMREKIEDLKKRLESAEAEARRCADEQGRTKKELSAAMKKTDEQAEGLARRKVGEMLAPVFKLETVFSGLKAGDLRSVPALLALAESGRCPAMIERVDRYISAAVILRDGLKEPPESLSNSFVELGELKKRIKSAEKIVSDIEKLKLSFSELKALSQKEDLADLISAAVDSGKLSRKEREEINRVVELMCERTAGRLSLGQLIRTGEQYLLIVDGHNLMHFVYEKQAFAQKEKNFETQKEQIPSAVHDRMKNRFIPDAFALLAGKSRSCRIKLYFDTSGPRKEFPLGNLTVIHSGGWGSQRADYSIINDAAADFAGIGVPKFISTNDKKLFESLKLKLPEVSLISPDDLNRLLVANACGDLTK